MTLSNPEQIKDDTVGQLMAMAAGEYVSVSSQAGTEHADLARESRELDTDTVHEREELA